jgi:hypothetical protein
VPSTTDGLVVDFRCCPSDFTVFKLGNYLMPKSIEFVKFTTRKRTNPGEIRFFQLSSVGNQNDNFYSNKVIILMDETTVSQAEYTAMALHVTPKAIAIGSTIRCRWKCVAYYIARRYQHYDFRYRNLLP